MKQTDAGKRNRTKGLLAWGLLFSMFLFGATGLSAQQKRITGTVSDANGPLTGVAVTVKGTSHGVTTDGQGRYTNSDVPANVLEFSFIGYQTQEIEVGSKTRIDVTMKDDATDIDEVVVIGYGTVKKRDLTGAVSMVKSQDLKMAPVANAVEALQGRVAGLDITRESGKANSGMNILLRGTRSLTASNEPIYIIDGIQGSISNLNPNDIASIDILKDASSTAIYGSAGANGVIIITTKQADKGKVQVDFDAYVGVNGFPKFPRALQGDAWLNYLEEGFKASNGHASESMNELLTAWGYAPSILEPYIKDGKWVDWVDETLKTGVQQNYSISVRGGNETTQGYFSLGYNSTGGIYKNDKSDMYTMRAGVNTQIRKWIKAGIQTGLSWKDNDSRNSRINKTFDMAPLGDVYDAEGNINVYPIEGDQSTVSLLADDVPGTFENNSKSLNVTINPYVDLTLAKGLTFRSILGASLSNGRTGQFNSDHVYMSLVGSSAPIRNANYDTSTGYSYTWENIANYDVTIADDHDLTATLISSWSNNQSEKSSAYNEGFLYDEFLYYSLSSGTNPSVSSSYTQKKKLSFAGRINYAYKGKYLLTVSSRWDGASQLANQWDVFPAAAVAWRISDEKFMEGTRGWLDNLKLRVGYGVSGNANIAAYVTKTEVTSTGLDAINLGSGQLTTSVLSKAMGNPNLGWEKSYNVNVGLDFSLFNNRIDASLEWYDTDTKDVLYKRKMPFTSGGFTAKNAYEMMSNIARMHNRGIEVTLNTRNIATKAFQWNSTLTFAYNKEQVKSIDLGSGTSVEDLISLGLYMGHPKSTKFGYKKLGIWQKGEEADAAVFGLLPGDVKVQSNLTKKADGVWVDKDGTEYTAENPYTISADDRVIYGQGSPKWTLGFQNSFYWKNFDLNVFLTMRWGHMINGGMLGLFRYGAKNLPDNYNYWTEDNPTNDYPRPYLNRPDADYSSPTSGLGAVDGSYMKIKNITLGYSLPAKICSKLGMSRLRVYGTVTNPLIVSKSHLLKGLDPETGASDSFPLYRQLVFGVNFSF